MVGITSTSNKWAVNRHTHRMHKPHARISCMHKLVSKSYKNEDIAVLEIMCAQIYHDQQSTMISSEHDPSRITGHGLHCLRTLTAQNCIKLGNEHLEKPTTLFTWEVRTIITRDGSCDTNIQNRISKASVIGGKLGRIWNDKMYY